MAWIHISCNSFIVCKVFCRPLGMMYYYDVHLDNCNWVFNLELKLKWFKCGQHSMLGASFIKNSFLTFLMSKSFIFLAIYWEWRIKLWFILFPLNENIYFIIWFIFQQRRKWWREWLILVVVRRNYSCCMVPLFISTINVMTLGLVMEKYKSKK